MNTCALWYLHDTNQVACAMTPLMMGEHGFADIGSMYGTTICEFTAVPPGTWAARFDWYDFGRRLAKLIVRVNGGTDLRPLWAQYPDDDSIDEAKTEASIFSTSSNGMPTSIRNSSWTNMISRPQPFGGRIEFQSDDMHGNGIHDYLKFVKSVMAGQRTIRQKINSGLMTRRRRRIGS